MNITKNIKIIFLYSSVFFILSLLTAYLPIWLNKELGLNPTTIGFLIGITGLLKIISNFFITKKIKSDIYLRTTLKFLVIIITLIYIFILLLDKNEYFFTLFFLIFLSLLLFSPIIPISETFCLEQNINFDGSYGKVRLAGSLSFMLGVIIFGKLIDLYSIKIFPIACFVSALLLLFVIFFLPKEGILKTQNTYENSLKKFAKKKFILYVIIFCSAIQACHAMYYGFSTILWKENGLNYSQIGTLWAWGVLAEIILFYKITFFKIKDNFIKILIFCGLISSLRWFLTFFTYNFYFLFALQTFHAISFALTHYLLMYFIYNHVPKKLRLISNYFYGALSGGLFMTMLSIFCGILYDWSLKGIGFLLMSLICLMSIFILFKEKERSINAK